MNPTEVSSFSPKAFLRQRRPDRFSDTRPNAPTLDRSILELRLATLTSHNLDTEFERFARLLAQKTICPNLRPQTGPTGGGDAKVDTETYPITESLALAWFVGDSTAAANERWAFAFSAKEEWRSKVRADVKKLVETGRGYTKAFFISSQAIKAKDSADMEDELRKAHGIEVWIHSRDWILDKVFTDHLEEIAVAELRIETNAPVNRSLGPMDAQRQAELAEVEKMITQCVQEGAEGPKLVRDCLRAAELARAMELSRTQLDGLFARALRAAKKHGSNHQIIEATYQCAWTAYNWHEDFAEFCELYTEVENLAKDSDSPVDLQLLNNLWFLLLGAVSCGATSRDAAQFDKRTVTLADSLSRIASMPDRPTAALRAKIILLIQQATFLHPNVPNSLFADLLESVRQTEGLVGYPFDPLSEIITEMGRLFSDHPGYDPLFETTCEIVTKRRGQTANGMMLLDRGFHLFEAGKYMDAIVAIGRSFVGLAKDETWGAMVTALNLCGSAYQQMGLHWAARGSHLNAASFIVSQFHESSDIRCIRSGAFLSLKWCELLLGRLPHMLNWHDTELKLRAATNGAGKELILGEDDVLFDSVVGILIQRATADQLTQMTKLPNAFDELGLICSRLALLYSLGHDEPLFTSFVRDEGESVDAQFAKWRSQPAAEELPPTITLGTEPMAELISQIQGCTLSLNTAQNVCCVMLGETILAGLEALLATGARSGVFAHEPRLRISIQLAEQARFPFEFEVKEQNGRPAVYVTCPEFNPNQLSREKQESMRTKLCDLAAHIFARVFPPSNFDQTTKKLFGDERGFERAFNFTGSFVTTANVLGLDPKHRVTDWIDEFATDYPLKRTEFWPQTLSSTPASVVTERPTSFNIDEVKQREIRTISLIRSSLWDLAEWCGAVFMWEESDRTPPIFGLIFKNQEAAVQLFDGLIEDVGRDNKDDTLKISIIRGIDHKNPYHYRIGVGSNLEAIPAAEVKHVALMCRMLKTEAATDKNLTGFLERVERFHTYFVVPAIFMAENQPPTPLYSQSIRMRKLTVRDAWTIGLNDPDCMAIAPEDDPMLPNDGSEAPVTVLLKWMKEQMSRL